MTVTSQLDQHGTGPMLVCGELRLSFGQTPALRGAGLSIEAGEVVAVMGLLRIREVDNSHAPWRPPWVLSG